MFTYEIKTRTPVIYSDNIHLNFKDDYLTQFEKILKYGLKNFLLLEYINTKKSEFNDFIEQTLDLFLFCPNIFLEKENSLNFYIKCALELEKKELYAEFKNIDSIKMNFIIPNQKNITENITLIDKEKLYKTNSLTNNTNIICQTNRYINFEKYYYYVKNILKKEEKFLKNKYIFFLLKNTKEICLQDFSEYFKDVNFLIINEIYSFLYNLNYKNYKKLNNLLTKNNMKKSEENLVLCINKLGKILPANFLNIEDM